VDLVDKAILWRHQLIARILLTAATFVISLVVFATVTIFGVLSLAGPHGGIVPMKFQWMVFILAWVIVLVVPALLARIVWKRASRTVRKH
jgi:hypothetical protein